MAKQFCPGQGIIRIENQALWKTKAEYYSIFRISYILQKYLKETFWYTSEFSLVTIFAKYSNKKTILKNIRVKSLGRGVVNCTYSMSKNQKRLEFFSLCFLNQIFLLLGHWRTIFININLFCISKDLNPDPYQNEKSYLDPNPL